MRLLFDECTPRTLRKELSGYEVRTVGELGWAGTRNGALLRRAVGQFDVLLTVDANLEYQQHIGSFPISVVVLLSYTNSVAALRPLLPELRALLPTVEAGRLYNIGPPPPMKWARG